MEKKILEEIAKTKAKFDKGSKENIPALGNKITGVSYFESVRIRKKLKRFWQS